MKTAVLSGDAPSVALPVSKGGAYASLLAAMNEAIEGLRSDWTLAELSNRFFGIDISETQRGRWACPVQVIHRELNDFGARMPSVAWVATHLPRRGGLRHDKVRSFGKKKA